MILFQNMQIIFSKRSSVSVLKDKASIFTNNLKSIIGKDFETYLPFLLT